tara:strand:+ start:2694 stop:3632 length:939 start_codon:yes stop_codon:yes gene_type:complete
MEQENIQTDTPQEGANEQQYASLEDAVFGGEFDDGSNDISNVFTTGEEVMENTEAAPVQQEPAQPSSPTQDTDNDTKRYQYWQSQADKMRAENERLQASMQQQAAMQQSQPQHQEPAQEEAFPDPPAKPDRPRSFSREEAYADPNSESARYLDEVESWRDDMVQYSSLKSDYVAAVQQEKYEEQERVRQDNIKRAQAHQQQNAQKNELADYVKGNHGFNEQEAVDFVNTMSDPTSINVDNLVQLYRLKQGQPVNNTAPAQPSPEFQQVQNAQQVPSPMGVLPSGQSASDNRSIEDKMIDKMIGDFNSKNPWK